MNYSWLIILIMQKILNILSFGKEFRTLEYSDSELSFLCE